MQHIDYTKYTTTELLQAKATIDKEANPENYAALIKEINSRDFDAEVAQIKSAKETNSLVRVTIIGYLQLLTALFFLYILFFNELSFIEGIIFNSIIFILFLLNATAGYTAIKKIKKWYWVSILNQSLQVINFGVGKLLYSYSALGGVYFRITNAEELNVGFLATIEPGLKFQYLNQTINNPTVMIDLLAIFFIVAIATAYKAKEK